MTRKNGGGDSCAHGLRLPAVGTCNGDAPEYRKGMSRPKLSFVVIADVITEHFFFRNKKKINKRRTFFTETRFSLFKQRPAFRGFPPHGYATEYNTIYTMLCIKIITYTQIVYCFRTLQSF